LDFTLSRVDAALGLKTCRDRKIAIGIGDYGPAKQPIMRLSTRRRRISILQAQNMSIGVNLLFKIARRSRESARG